MLLKRFSSASSKFYYLGYRGFVSRVQVLPTGATPKTVKALPIRCSGEAPPGARGIGKFHHT